MTQANDDRRRFIGMSFAAGVAMTGLSEAASQGQPEALPAKQTYLVIYRPGPGWVANQPLAAQPLKEHGRHLLDLYRRGALRYAGPFTDESGGAAMIEAADAATAKALVAADPTIAAQVLTFQLYGWMLRPWAQYAEQQDKEVSRDSSITESHRGWPFAQ